jgi:hypothetical protein
MRRKVKPKLKAKPKAKAKKKTASKKNTVKKPVSMRFRRKNKMTKIDDTLSVDEVFENEQFDDTEISDLDDGQLDLF